MHTKPYTGPRLSVNFQKSDTCKKTDTNTNNAFNLTASTDSIIQPIFLGKKSENYSLELESIFFKFQNVSS